MTFLFTDIEGSTKLLHELGADAYSDVLSEHRRILRDAFHPNRGVEVDTQGDAFFIAFPTASEAVEAAQAAQDSFSKGTLRVRMGIHTGTPHLSDEGYVGEDVHKGARIASAGHGGQVLLSTETRGLISAEVTDLGEHRIKDFAEPIGIFQLGSERFPPLKTISNTNLPRPASSFIGRTQELEDVVALLDDGARLLTLTGAGGSGKTRLSIEAAAELIPRFRNGVFWVDLSALRDPALVGDSVAQILGAKVGLAEHVGEREMLLVLDNLEQVIEAAPQMAALVETCPNLRLLVTSRERLRVRGEVEYQVPPLARPDAVRLFCARSGLAPDAAIIDLCDRLDNLPLAVELAAARTRVLSPAQILSRLSDHLDLLKGGRDADARQRTLRATIEWSHDLLSLDEKALFARLGVFAGGCTLEAAESIVEAEMDTLESLVEKSLLRHADERFWMLETIRAFAIEQLDQTAEERQIRERHVEYYLALAEEGAPYLSGIASKQWLDRQANDHDNIRAAFDRLRSSGRTQDVLRLAAALTEFWQLRGHLTEGARLLDAALSADDSPTPARAQALQGAGDIASWMEDSTTQRRVTTESIALFRTFGNRRGVALALWGLGVLSLQENDPASAQKTLEEAVVILREINDEHYELHVNRALAWSLDRLGDVDGARTLSEDTLRRARILGNQYAIANSLAALASLAIDGKNLHAAMAMMRECDAVLRELGDLPGILENLSRVAKALVIGGRATIAAQILGCFEAFNEEVGTALAWVRKQNEETLDAIREVLDEASVAEAWSSGRRLRTEEALALGFDADL